MKIACKAALRNDLKKDDLLTYTLMYLNAGNTTSTMEKIGPQIVYYEGFKTTLYFTYTYVHVVYGTFHKNKFNL